MKITHMAGIALLAVISTTPAFGQTRYYFPDDGPRGYAPAGAIHTPEVPALAALQQPAPEPAPAVKPEAGAAPAAEAKPAAEPPAAPAAPAPEEKVPPAPAAPAAAPPAPAAEAAPPAAPAKPAAPKPDNAIASPSDAPAPPVVAAPKVELDRAAVEPTDVKSVLKDQEDSCCDQGCTCGGWLPCNPDKQWKLPQPCFLQQHKTVLGGWLQQGVTFNDHSSNGFNGPVATNDLAAEYQINQMWLYLHRPADTGGCGFAWGGHIDMMYGTDGRFGINKGLEDHVYDFDRDTYGIVIPQFYLELAYNDLSVKLGHFAGILDYEAVPGPMNPFYSHSYSYGYTVPQLVTGFLADYKLSDQWSVQAGMHRGWMQFEDYNDSWDVMAGVKWQSCDEKTELRYAVSSGKQTFPWNDENRFVYSLVLQHQVTDSLKYVLVHNLGHESNMANLGGIDAEWYGLNQYFLYTINPCWAVNLRAEWMRDDDGTRIAGPGNIPGIRAWDGAGYAGDFFEVSLGLNWRPNGNWLVRPELRWDWYDGPDSLFVPAKPAMPFNDGVSDDQMTFGVDAIFQF